MKKRLFALLVAIAVVLSGNCFAFAAEETDETQIFMIPMSEEESGQKDRMSLSSTEESIVIDNVYHGEVVSDYFNIYVEMYPFKDARKKLTVSVVDENGNVVAEQLGAYYDNYRLTYKMKMTEELEGWGEYLIKLEYNGKYNLENYVDEAYFYPNTSVWVQDVKILDKHHNIFLLTMANTEINTNYTLFYNDANYDPYSVDASTDENNCIMVEFGQDAVFSYDNAIYICEQGEENYWNNYLCEIYLNDYETYDVLNEGISCDEYIEKDAQTVYFGLYEKGYAMDGYSSGDETNIDVYLFDVTAGRKVTSGIDWVEFDDSWGEIYGEVIVSSTLYTDHEYMMVVDDGYSLRAVKISVTDEKRIENINVYNSAMGHITSIPSGTSSFYVKLNTLNIGDGKASVEMKNSSSQVVATSSYDSSKQAYLMTVTGPLTEGRYTLTAKSGTASLTKSINVTDGQAASQSTVRQNVRSSYIIGGVIYTVTEIIDNAGYYPSSLAYKIVLSDGTEFPAEYHRTLYSDENEICFVVKADFPEGNIRGAMLKMYNYGQYLAPQSETDMKMHGINYIDDADVFVYDVSEITQNSVTLYTEGINSYGTYTLCGYNEETNEAVEITAYGSNSVTFNKSQIDSIVSLYELGDDGYNDNTKTPVLEYDNDFLTELYNVDIGKKILLDSFSFQRAYTSEKYEIINLPYNTYDYYKLAASEAGLNSESYKDIETGILYELEEEEGVQTVYAKFKTSSGKESAVRKISIFFDATTPELTVLRDLSGQYTMDATEGDFQVPYYVEASEEGILYVEFFDKGGNKLGYEYSSDIYEGINAGSVYVYDEGELKQAETVKVYMEDGAGNKSEEFTFDVSLVYNYENLEITYAYFGDRNEELSVYTRKDMFYEGDVILAAVYDENNKLLEVAKKVIEEDRQWCYLYFENPVESGRKVKVFVFGEKSEPFSYANTIYAE